MTVTKYEHACVVLEEQGKKLVIDPGSFTKSLTDLSNIVSIVITHDHQDHFDKSLVKKIIDVNPEVKIFTVKSVADQLSENNVQVVKAGSDITIVPFELTIYGGEHALIHATIPKIENFGVMVDKTFYYPGDSFSMPDGAPVAVLALPVSAPWLKVGECMDFLMAVKPKVAFPTHNGLHNDISERMSNNLISKLAKNIGTTYQILEVDKPVEF